MSVCLNTTAVSAHVLPTSSVSHSSFVKVSRAVAEKNKAHQPPGGWALCHTVIPSSLGRNKHSSPSVSLWLRALDQQPGCAWSKELLPQHVPIGQLAQTQQGGCLQSTWMHTQLFPAQQSCSSPSLEIKVLTRSQLLSPLGVCPLCLQENSYVLVSFTPIIPKFRQQWTGMQWSNSESSSSAFNAHTELVLVTYNS